MIQCRQRVKTALLHSHHRIRAVAKHVHGGDCLPLAQAGRRVQRVHFLANSKLVVALPATASIGSCLLVRTVVRANDPKLATLALILELLFLRHREKRLRQKFVASYLGLPPPPATRRDLEPMAVSQDFTLPRVRMKRNSAEQRILIDGVTSGHDVTAPSSPKS